MFRLVKLGMGLCGLVAFAWFGLTVKLGSQTLFQHLRAIGQSKESHDLVEGTREAAGPLVKDVRQRIAGHEPTKPVPAPAAEHTADDSPEEHVSTTDRQALHRLIRRVDRPTREP
ncbi:MAG TPA: hypothetical protein VMT03_09915 [Polyangia bacterium]|nr:hypothetical protein [Polyangia bacterium]